MFGCRSTASSLDITGGNLGATLAGDLERVRIDTLWPRQRGPPPKVLAMKPITEAALCMLARGACRTLLAATLNAMLAACDHASAQTAFTLPAPPFELPLLPPVSGSAWTVMIGAEGRYRPDFEGA